jgi:hypothetical protein
MCQEGEKKTVDKSLCYRRKLLSIVTQFEGYAQVKWGDTSLEKGSVKLKYQKKKNLFLLKICGRMGEVEYKCG